MKSFIQQVKRKAFMYVAYFVKLFKLRNEAWYREHLSRYRHEVEYRRKQGFEHGNYSQWLMKRSREKPSEFVPLSSTLGPTTHHEGGIKPIAFYLPQFHPIPENNEWHGRGFTEWTNVTRSIPQFVGHHQPQLPIDVGFYDLTNPDVMYRQVELAKQYGIHGFCFHTYWFSGGKRLLEAPMRNWLENKDLDFPFCINWANENWSKLWDGGDRQVLMKQQSCAEDAGPFLMDMLPYLQDPRYIRVDGKPLLIIYRPGLFTKEEFIKFAQNLRACATQQGLGELFLAMVYNDNFEESPLDWGLNGAVEFPPQRIVDHRRYVTDGNPINPDFKGYVYTLDAAIEDGSLERADVDFPLFRGIFPRWDNTARKAYSNASVYQLSPAMYQKWLSQLIRWTRARHEPEQRYIFINAWNEWAEGAQLEPDSRYGYAYLQATRDALQSDAAAASK